jgi:hypothetical protein
MPKHAIAHRRRRGLPTKAKAKKMLSHGEVKGKPLTSAQKGMFGIIAGGRTPTKVRRLKRRRK